MDNKQNKLINPIKIEVGVVKLIIFSDVDMLFFISYFSATLLEAV